VDLAYRGLGDIVPPRSRAVSTTPSTFFALCALNERCNQFHFIFHARSNGGEGGSEVVEGLCQRGTRVANREGDELHPSPEFFEGRDEGGYFSVFFLFQCRSRGPCISRSPRL